MIPERLAALRQEMKKRNITIYIVPTADFHGSEYVGESFKTREFITGFTGSAGTAVITETEAGLWTDGRYFIQAENQLKDSTITLYRMYNEGVPTVMEYLEKELQEGGCIGFDGRVVNANLADSIREIAEKKHGSVYSKEDLLDGIWKDRPEMSAQPTWVLEEKYAGESVESKLKRIREQMEKENADVHIMSSLYNIAWTYNMRGDDIENVPVFLSFSMITMDKAYLYLNEKILTDATRKHLHENHMEIRAYDAIYEDIRKLPEESKILLNKEQTNSRITDLIPEGAKIIHAADPAEKMKSIKNETELSNLVKAHIKDGVALTRFMYWLKKNVGKIPMTEASVQDKLEEFRLEQENCLGVSFDTICGYGPNAAMMHYAATKENCATLEPKGMLLVDSGGHYLEGSTDVTRNFALGPVTPEEKKHFTAVCRSNLNLANARFLYGCTGYNLDILTRGPIWDLDLDYQCGTGHGVGYLLNIHEGPNCFYWYIRPGRKDYGIFEEGQVTTDEPGIYLEGKYGIRIENELICRKGEKNMYGQFMYFENITYAPIDLDLIDPEEMDRTDKKRLNDYHKKVYDTISPYLDAEEREWLKEYTRAI
ncbi:MAG: aminopeptidase P family protein [Lachnospiraceae bacterium]